MLARYMMAPKVGHLEAIYHLFGYLEQSKDGKIVVDLGEAPIRKKAKFLDKAEWTEFYEDTEEAMPQDMPEPLGNMAILTIYVDADHARDM